MSEKILARFTRETTAKEDTVVHREGDEAEMSTESFTRWSRRGAVVQVEPGKSAPKTAPKTAAATK